MKKTTSNDIIRQVLDELVDSVEGNEVAVPLVGALYDFFEKEVGVHSDGGVVFGTDIRPDLQRDMRLVEGWIKQCGYKWSAVMRMGTTRRDIRLMRKLVIKGMNNMGWTKDEIATAFKTTPSGISRMGKEGRHDAVFVTTTGTLDSRTIAREGDSSGARSTTQRKRRASLCGEGSVGGEAVNPGAHSDKEGQAGGHSGDDDLDR